MHSFGLRIVNRGYITPNLITRLQSTTSDVTSNSSLPEIHIPIRKERGPTDILCAIERTIRTDPTAPRYKYHDDPFLIPYSNMAKRSYALAEESGRKAAMWIREQHADLFQHREADPIIESFLPKPVYNKKEDVNEDILKKAINEGDVNDAVSIYKLLNEETTIETKQSLFELLCYYNNANSLSDELLEQNWHRRIENYLSWKACPITKNLFNFLKEQDTKTATDAYNTFICGIAKYMQIGEAWRLFEEAEKNNITLYLNTYNHIISIISYLTVDGSERQKLLMDVLQKIKKSGFQPNIDTFNSSLQVASTIMQSEIAQKLCCSLFSEFKHIGIEPSLASYYYALKIFYAKNNTKKSLLKEILDHVGNKEFKFQDMADANFFILAMEIANEKLEDSIIGDRIHQLLLTGKNYEFLTNAFHESIYYRNFCILQTKSHTIDNFFTSYYDLIVPNIYTPEASVMAAIVNAFEVNDPVVGTPLLARFWTHLVQFNHLERKHLISKILRLMRIHCKPDAMSPINKMFSDAAWTVWEYVNNAQIKRIATIDWNGVILADIAVLLLRGGELKKCSQIASYFYDKQDCIVEVPHQEQIEELFTAYIVHGDADAALNLMHYCSDVEINDVSSMARRIWANLPLNEWQENRLRSLVGPDVLKAKEEAQ